MLIYRFVIGSFLVGYIVGDFVFLLFLGMCFSGVTLALVPPEKLETSARILSSPITYFGADGYDGLIKYDALVSLCVLIYYLGILSFPEIGATNFSFAYFSYHLIIMNP